MIRDLVSRCSVILAFLAIGIGAPLRVGFGQATETTLCKDGTTSASAGRGACSGHGGVDKAATKAARTPTTTERAAAQVTCSDGTMSKAGRGACSRHGGVASNAPAPGTAAPTTAAPPSRVSPRATTLPAPLPAEVPARTRSDAGSRAPSVVGSGAREDNDPSGAIAQCKDGLYSHSKHRRGACSRHGGVGKWLTS
jgi:Protein of unknown function (DUF3761)